MSARRFLVAVGLLALGLLALKEVRREPRPLPHVARAQRRAPASAPLAAPSRAAPSAAARAPVAAPPRPTTELPADATTKLEGIPGPEDLDAIHPGLRTAYQRGFSEALAGLTRARHRCALFLPDRDLDLEWEAVETYEPDETGGGVLSGYELHPKRGGEDHFYDCLAEESLGQTRVPLPEGFSGSFQVRTRGQIMWEAPDPDRARAEVEVLRRRLADSSLGDERRAVLAEHLALWQCYADRGPAGRRDCLATSSE